jgi:hypothetical protein
MANRFPLVVDQASQKIKELPSGDNLDLTGNSVIAVRNILPESDSTYSLGSAEKRWSELYLSSNSLHIGESRLSFAGSSFVFQNGNETVSLPISGNTSLVNTSSAQTLENKTISGSANTLSNIGNSSLLNSSVVIGDTAISLGETETALTGLTSVTSTSFVGNVTGDVTGDVTGNLTGDVTGNVTGNLVGDVTGNLTGNASTSSRLTEARTIELSGNVTGSADFDGSGDIQITTSIDINSIDLSATHYTKTESDSRFVNTNGDTMTGFLTLHANPTSALHAAPKQYVDQVAEGLTSRPAVEVATTANLNATYDIGAMSLIATANGAFPEIDGVTLTSTIPGENGVLVKNQTNPAHNGRYVLTQVGDINNRWVLARCPLCNESDEIPGSYTFVKAGNFYAGTGWVLTVFNPSTFVLGVDQITVNQFSGAGTFTAGAGLELDGVQFSHADTSTIGSAASSTSNTGNRFIQNVLFTFDTFGHVTNASLSTGNVTIGDGTLTLATSGIATGSQTFTADQDTDVTFTVDVPGTNIAEGTRTTTTVPVTSSTGTGATLSAATTSLAGVMSADDKSKLDGIEAGAEVNVVTSVAGKTGEVVLSKSDVGLNNVDNTADSAKSVASAATLTTARTINEVSFDGSADITVTANTTNALTRGTYLTGSNFNGSAATTWAVDATSANTADKVVARDASGNFSAGVVTVVDLNSTSDERLKTNWRPLPENFLDELCEVKHGIYDRTDVELTQAGVSAQSLQRVLKETVSEDEQGMLSVSYGNAALVAVIELTKLVKEQQKQIEELRTLLNK